MSALNRRLPLGDGFFSFTRRELLVKLILLFPLSTLLQNYLGFLNKLLFFAVVALMLCVGRVGKKVLIYLGCVTATWLICMLNTTLEMWKLNFNMAFYYLFLVFYMVFFVTRQQTLWEILLRNRRYILFLVGLYTAIVTVSIFLPGSYGQMTAGGWGDSKYFMSVSASPNRVGPASVFVVVLLAFLIRTGSHRAVALMALPQAYVFLMGGSRTYFVVGLCSLLVLYYVVVPRKKWFFWSLLPMGIVVLLVTLQSSMMDKFLATFRSDVTGPEFWRRLTNSRSVFWVTQLRSFSKTSLFHQLLGNGVNYTTHVAHIWAHNDFIEILCSYGYVGLVNYTALMLYTIRTLLRPGRRHFFIKAVCVFIWFFNAFLNFFFCYFCAMLCYPILLLTVKHMDDPS